MSRNSTHSIIIYCKCAKGFIQLLPRQRKCPDCLHGIKLEKLRYDFKQHQAKKMSELIKESKRISKENTMQDFDEMG